MAAAYDSSVAIRLLRARRAALWTRDSSGRTPLAVARLARGGKSSNVVRTLLLLRRPDAHAAAEPDDEC